MRKTRQATGAFGVVLHVERNLANMELDDLSLPTRFHLPNLTHVTHPPDQLVDRWTWAHSQGGEHLGETTIMLTIQATADIAIVIDAQSSTSATTYRPME